MISIDYTIMFYDADPAGILFFGNFFRIMHFAFEKYLGTVNLFKDFFENPEYIFPVKTSTADFKIPVKHGNKVKIEIEIAGIRKSSFEVYFKMVNPEGKLCAEGKTVHVCVDKKTGQKATLPESILSVFGKNLS